MTTLLVILAVVLAGLSGGGLLLYLHSRRTLREQKNFERGLKMVPLLIHLPPLSDDTDENGRDVRDLIDENISKAQVLYSIIASSFKKGFKSKFYGQRHFAFEIIGSRGFVHYYAAVPVTLVDVVKQAVISAYPSAQLEEVAEHNIFSPVGRISGTIGGELSLKEEYAYPIATYQELKRDAMQSILNALSTLDKEDGAGIQFLMRPANPEWRKSAQAIATKKRKGEKSSSGGDAVWHWVKQLAVAFAKPPEAKGGGDKDKKELSSMDQAIVDAIDDKTRYPAYEVLIRVVASSNVSQRAQAILNNMVAAFSLFDAPGKNGFKYTAATDIESFVTAFILRFFPQENTKSVLNSVELATMFHFPDQKNIPTSQLIRQASKQVDGPRNVPEDGLLLGYNVFRGAKKPIRLSLEDRRRHMYVVGQTGTGKSNFLENLALQDMLAGRGFAFVDPHGETVDRLISMVPRERTEDVIYFSPADMEYPMGLNIFEFYTPEQKDFLIQEAINMLQKLYDPNNQGIIGPRYEHLFRNAALTVMSGPDGGTFVDIPKLFNDRAYVNQKLKHVTDQNVLDFWNKEMPGSERSNDFGEVKSWFVSKFGAFLSNEMMRNIIGQTKSSFNLRDVMDNKKILLVNLSKGRTGELNSKLLGMIFVMKFQAAAMSRASIPEDQREDFCLYVDEFQNFSTDSFATILSEARKYHLNLIVANQFTTQLTDEIRDAVFGNVGSIVSFRVGADADADALSKKFQPIFEREDVLRIPNYNTISQILIGGIPTQPFSMATLPPLGTPNEQLGTALKQLSAAKYGRAKALAEKEIFARLAVQEQPKPAFGPPAAGAPFGGGPNRYPAPAPGAFGPSPYGAAPSAAPRPASSGSSFLDDWLAKRQAPAGGPVGVAPTPPMAPTPQPSVFGSAPAPFAPVGSVAPAVTSDSRVNPAPAALAPSAPSSAAAAPTVPPPTGIQDYLNTIAEPAAEPPKITSSAPEVVVSDAASSSAEAVPDKPVEAGDDVAQKAEAEPTVTPEAAPEPAAAEPTDATATTPVVDDEAARTEQTVATEPEEDTEESFDSTDDMPFDPPQAKSSDEVEDKPFDQAQGEPSDGAQGKPTDETQDTLADEESEKPEPETNEDASDEHEADTKAEETDETASDKTEETPADAAEDEQPAEDKEDKPFDDAQGKAPGEVKLHLNKADGPVSIEGDTITIDDEGTLHVRGGHED